MNTAKPDLQRGSSALVIAQTIRNDIESGVLPHGHPLPSTRKLAAEWDTSIATINRAMAQLADAGLVINRDRAGRLINFPTTTQSSRKVGQPGGRPQVMLIGGYAGSGKTELGRVIARSTGWAMLDKDTITRPVVEAALELLGEAPSDRESETYLSKVRPTEYDALMTTMSENVKKCGNSVILTAPFINELSDQAWCDRLAANINSIGADLHVIWVFADTDTMRYYLKHRGAARDSYKLTHWNEYITNLDLNFQPHIKPFHIVNNSVGSEPLQKQAANIINSAVPA